MLGKVMYRRTECMQAGTLGVETFATVNGGVEKQVDGDVTGSVCERVGT